MLDMISLRIDPELRARLDRYTSNKRRSEFIRTAVTEHLDRLDRAECSQAVR